MKQFIFDNWLLLSPILYEIIVRVWPTKWNISLLDNLWKLINFFIPNKRIASRREKQIYLDASGKDKNMIGVRTDKHVLKIILILCLFSFSAQAQIWQNFKGVRLVNNSDTTKQLAVQGSIFYDDVNDSFWGRNNFGWKKFGLGVSSGDFWKTGGTTNLISPVTIQAANAGILFNDAGGFETFIIDNFAETIIGDGSTKFSTNLGVTGITINPSINRIFNNNGGAFFIANDAGTMNLQSSTFVQLLGQIRFADNIIDQGFDINPSAGTIIQNRAATNFTLQNNGGDIITIGNHILQPANSNSELFGGTYTPTVTPITNADASNAQLAYFTRVENIVTVSGEANVISTAAGSATVALNLPISSNFTLINDATGHGSVFNQVNGNTQGPILGARTATDDVQLTWLGMGAATTSNVFYSFTYIIK